MGPTVTVRQRSVRSVENIAAADASVEENPNVSMKPLDYQKRRIFENWAGNNLKKIRILIEKSSSAMRLISG